MSHALTIEPEVAKLSRPQNNAMTPMDMLNTAVAGGASIEVLEKLMTLQERWEKNQARKEFDAAMSAAKADIPTISKNRTVDYTPQGKGRVFYQHEDLAGIAETVNPILARNGLSYRFRTSSNINEPVIVTCIVSHKGGYSEENSLAGPRDEGAGKNSLQAIGSTLTYLQRMTLKAALGLAAAKDDDAAKSEEPSLITDAQRDDLKKLIDATGTDIAKFCEAFEINGLAEMPTASLARAITLLNQKKAQKK